MGLLSDFKESVVSALPFSVAWMQARCLSHNHKGRKRVLIKQQTIEEHPANDEDIVYTVALFRCKHCGLIGTDAGFELREPLD